MNTIDVKTWDYSAYVESIQQMLEHDGDPCGFGDALEVINYLIVDRLIRIVADDGYPSGARVEHTDAMRTELAYDSILMGARGVG